MGEVSCPASRKVPIAIDMANTINNMPVSLFENNIFAIFFNIKKKRDIFEGTNLIPFSINFVFFALY